MLNERVTLYLIVAANLSVLLETLSTKPGSESECLVAQRESDIIYREMEK
jgi:hypothetical protein